VESQVYNEFEQQKYQAAKKLASAKTLPTSPESSTAPNANDEEIKKGIEEAK
jgi:hypothetical protein